jgi:catechol 2,3-dioxygenase-like lactoylglutathione lyase family enzyme
MNPIHHIGYWVTDLDEAVDRLISTLGVGPFLAHRNVTFDSFVLADGTVIEDPQFFDHTAAFACWGSIAIEIDVVHTVDPWLADAYKIGTDRVGHISWVVDDLAGESARLNSAGCQLIHTASSGAVSVAWHDGGALFPHPIEVHQAGAPILGMHARLSELADEWDGSNPIRPMRG